MTEWSAEGPRICVVDDEKILLDVFSSLMHRYHYRAHLFSNPLVALEKIMLDPGHYQLLIVDIRMPQMDGITFAKKVRAIRPDVPIIFMTGVADGNIRKEVESFKNTAFLEKPFPLEEALNQLIPKLLDSQKKTPN